jgi:hypothetical protein
MSQRDVYLDFDQECDVHSTIDVVPSQSEAARKLRKRMDNFNKRKRLTVFAAATGARASLPARHTYALANVEREPVTLLKQSAGALVATCKEAVTNIFSYLTESELSTKVTPVCKEWSDWATLAHAQLLLTSVQRMEEGCPTGSGMERSWHFIHKLFPWARYLAEGGAKKVYKVHNSVVNMEEAVSVM